jgi:hypothetical protein
MMDQKMNTLVEVANQLGQSVNTAIERWRDLPEPALRFRPSTDDWSAKEIIGHLIDSASNNHQRWVRLQLTERLTFPNYGQDNIHWVRIQNYQDRSWPELLDLWRHFNNQLAHIMRSVDASCLSHVWQANSKTRYTLFDLMTDYLRHLEDHLDQIGNTLSAFKER